MMSPSTRAARKRNGPRCPNACDSCKRRKEKCNGQRPCTRCLKRKVEHSCYFSDPRRRDVEVRPDNALQPSEDSPAVGELEEDPVIDATDSQPRDLHLSHLRIPVPGISRLLRDPNSSFVFIGEYANLSFLHNVRHLVQSKFGLWQSMSQPGNDLTMQSGEVSHHDWLSTGKDLSMAKPDIETGKQLLADYLWSTSCILDVLDPDEIKAKFRAWLSQPVEPSDPVSPKYYLILALGAQASPEFSDEDAESYFNAGRYLTMTHFIDKPAILGIQCHILITMFLIGASRRDAAFLSFGNAERAAYALGIHRRNISRVFRKAGYEARERAWRNIRTLDVFLACSLGRPMATSESRNALAGDNYSAVAGLCYITESIFSGIYGKSVIDSNIVESISKNHRIWLSLLREGLAFDNISPELELTGSKRPNMGLYHIRNGYYVSIILLTRPFLIHMVSQNRSRHQGEKWNEHSSHQAAPDAPETAYAYACVDSATRIISQLRNLVKWPNLPKHLPFVVNSVSVAALVVGLAFFANLDQRFPLYECLWDSTAILKTFAKHDLVARLYLAVIKDLESACRAYVTQRDRPAQGSEPQLMGGQFGKFQIGERTEQPVATALAGGGGGGGGGGSSRSDESVRDQPSTISDIGTADLDSLDAAYFDFGEGPDITYDGLHWTLPAEETENPQQHSQIEVDEINFDPNVLSGNQASWSFPSRYNATIPESVFWPPQ
ncbi:uncharacterized protein Z520_01671 [Fonsecaea multimorphosa CBS 102226]|uniref:Zn(2)-C6 fungal-type domain-containing protein n=1 Tax=Fonsecaea multimorphosa CBS 102226 TaxID=1442371 RepID=A0A0D2L2C2_9EURO|nr:uncharacterized protein Z520_01671 [Fonsecaea multimorphosa CBS 102226]KIY03204.1 hypothetical protein Z520_01671 [Fonsecaea multimorphosa CBS 102226]